MKSLILFLALTVTVPAFALDKAGEQQQNGSTTKSTHQHVAGTKHYSKQKAKRTTRAQKNRQKGKTHSTTPAPSKGAVTPIP
jgi:hypothetical protein